MILLLNGAFGVGKTTVARALRARLPDCVLFDPEPIGIALQRLTNLSGRRVEDFQDLKLWRTLTVAGLHVARWRSRSVVVPMAISNPAYWSELKFGISRFEREVVAVCLVAPKAVVHARLRQRGADPVRNGWEFRRSSECCDAHITGAFGQRVDAAERSPEEIVNDLLIAAGIVDCAA